MQLKNLFTKPVSRPIEGVIKADDDASLRLEIEEYVLTNEVAKRLEGFLDAYNNYEGANGVWISGFFGSGKSHLLKMLALLLENREIDGTKALDLFLPKCTDNEILRGDLKRAAIIPSKSILFNIDQKADVISKTQIDALLSVFVKVFDETCGYYGKLGHIAQFERDLDSRDLYTSFKTAYTGIANKPWEKGREQALLESPNIAKAYAEVTNTPESNAIGILDKYRSQYRVSIEDFAEKVKAFIDRQAPEFRLNFFIDEVGQYIAENVKLMTNLQTIAESLATKCRGRAWIVVTSQNDMSTMLGEMNKQQSNDFSKIMARFSTKMLLTSTNVAEVIQKRLLSKTDEGAELVSDLYHREVNNFGTLFRFTDGSREYKIYRDRDEFVRSYPFVPYQFDLFQSAIENLSRHNAFEGKHSSVGERSMLGVFQQVAIHISDYEIGQIATFDLMFEGIQTALKSQTQRSILAAQRQLNNDFAVKLLKALFLVKYVKEFKPTVRNICILMQDHFGQDIPALHKKVEESLNILELQTFIQRNGEHYEYLTDEEKDVEEEIKNTEVSATDVAAELEKIVFDAIIKNRKIRYDANGQDYTYSRKLDDRLHGREYELAIHVVSPFHENAGNGDLASMHSMGKDELLVLMAPNDRLVRDILMLKKTEKYIRQTVSITQQESIKRILSEKSLQNRERAIDLQKCVYSSLAKARLFVAGSEIDIPGEDAQIRICKGFYELITRVYPNLTMLRGITYTENDIATCLKQAQDGLFANDAPVIAESEQELLAYIQNNSRTGMRTTLKNCIERFERKPYGWYYPAILCTVAKLCARGKVEVRQDSNLLEGGDLERALKNSYGHANSIIDPQVDFTPAQIRGLKEFFEDFFDIPPKSSEAKALGKETVMALSSLIDDLIPFTAQRAQYPFLASLEQPVMKLKELSGKPYTWYLTDMLREEQQLLDMKEKIIDPVRKFMNGPLKELYDSARKFLTSQEPNFAYVDGDEHLQIATTLSEPECYKGNRMQQVKALLDSVQQKVSSHIEQEIQKTITTVESLKNRLHGMSEFTVLPSDKKEKVEKPFDDFIATIRRQRIIAVIRDYLRRFEDTEYQRLLSMLATLAQPEYTPVEPMGDTSTNETFKSVSAAPETAIEYINCRTLNIPFGKAWLADENDVSEYLEATRKLLLDEIKKGKRIRI